MANFKEIIEQSFSQYAGSVIQSRSLVDVRDCLKPSARQIFYCMETDKFTAERPFQKTLKSIGSAMKAYIHGDSSCEGIIMRAGQPFALRYPLIEVEGSYGNPMESANWAAPRYCVTGDTLINTSKGLIKIEDIIKTEENSDNPIKTLRLKGFDKETTTNLIFNSGKQETYTITLKNGIQITGTENHPLLTLDENLSYSWKTIEELNKGDKVLLNLAPHTVFGKYNDIHMAKALGCLVSEGCLTQKGVIDIINSDENMLIPVLNILKQYGSNANICERITQADKCKYIHTTNQNLYNFLYENECCKYSADKEIPKCIKEGTFKVQTEFLKYLFEGDGCVSLHKNNSYGTITYSSVSKKLIKELQIMLLSNFGIISSIHTQTGRNEYKLEIGGEDLSLFYSKIGFVSNRKQEILSKANDLYINQKNTGSRGWHIFPEIKQYLIKNYPEAKLIIRRNNRADECKGPLMSKRGLPILKNKLNDSDYQKIENLYCNYAYIEIESKVNSGINTVYSPKVNEPTNEFTSNGLISHNTSARLSAISANLFADIKKNTIDEWRDNYDDTMQYPAVLPSKGFYNIVNGTFGIGVGIASSIPQFNLREVNAALITLINNPDASFEELYCPPDFATGGILINEEAIKESLKKGNGSACCLRAKFDYDSKSRVLTVIEIPYNVYTNTICQELEGIVNGEENPGIEKINDLTGKEPCIKIYLDKNANPDYIKNYLYKNTSLQSSYGINLTMLDNGRYPKVFSWKEALQAHLTHEKEVYIRGFKYDLEKIKYRIKIVEAIIKAIASIEEVIELIKTSSSTSDANQKLQKFLNIDEDQAKAILDIKLARLAKLEIEKYEKELIDLKAEAERIEKILNSEELLKNEIINGLQEVAKKYGDKRRTEVINLVIPKEEKEIAYVEPEKCVVVLTEGGCVKRIPSTSFRTQKRNGKGVRTQDDITSMVLRTNTVDSLMIFTNRSKMYRLLVDNIPVGTNVSAGVPITSLVEMENGEKPIVIYSIYRDTDAEYVLFVTKNGLVKKTALSEYIKTKKKSGITAINIKDGDELVTVSLVKDEELILLTKQGMGIRFKSTDVGATGRATAGIKGMGLKEDDEVIAALPIRHSGDQLAIFHTSGTAKKFPITDLPLQNRAGKGVKCTKTEEISCAALISDEDNLLVCGDKSSICLAAKDITSASRSATGTIAIKGNKILSVSKV